ncbi:MAG: hypothetical protein GQ574_02840 [Crocinitomix sp.]|nr:hypothetical protein [Crocinitomix sp.]
MEKPGTLELYRIATTLKKEGKDDYAIEQALLMKGLNQEEARKVISRANATTLSASGQSSYSGQKEKKEGNGMWGWAIWILALGLINLLSYLFNWNFWLY